MKRESPPVPELFRGLPTEAWRQIKKRFVLKKLQEGEEVCSPRHREGFSLFIVFTGIIEILAEDIGSPPVHLFDIMPGEFFGEEIVMADGRSFCSAAARQDTELLALPESDYHLLLTRYPGLNKEIIASITGRLNRMNRILGRHRRKKSLMRRYIEETAPYREASFIVATKAMKPVPELIRNIAREPGPVLVEGEYGCGKQLVAWQIHQAGASQQKAFIPVDCGQLTDENWEEKLLGRGNTEGALQGEDILGAIELAEGGTLFLKNCDQLSFDIQRALREIIKAGRYHRPGLDEEQSAGCRFIAAARGSLAEAVEAGAFDRELHEILLPNRVTLPPLRDRKGVIPHLVDYFVKKYAPAANREDMTVTPEAMKELLNYDYRLANIKELEQIIERAVALPSDNRIWPRHLFLGAPAVEPDKWYYDLLQLKTLGRWVRNRHYPERVQYVTAAVFALLIAFSLLGTSSAVDNPGTLLVWGLWWPIMFLSFFFVGRTWCSICAYSAYSRFLQKKWQIGLRLPSFVRNNSAVITAAAFLIILWVEEITNMRASPRATGFLMLTMLSLALACAVVFRRDSWCRYLCPLGSMIGTCSMSSIVELRSNTEVCRNRCKTSECYHGTPDSPGCPMFDHLLFVDNNQTCKLCLQCVRSCPNRSVSLNLRLPGREIWLLNQKRDQMSLFVCVLLGSVLPVFSMQAGNLELVNTADRLLFTGAHFLAPVFMAALLWAPNLLCPPSTRRFNWPRFWYTAYAYVPLGVAAHFAYRLHHLIGARGVGYSIRTQAAGFIEGPIIQPVQLLSIVMGMLYSWFCLTRVRKNRQGKDFEAPKRFWYAHTALIWGYAAVVLIRVLQQ